jgi:hypothetical protein
MALAQVLARLAVIRVKARRFNAVATPVRA